MARIVAFALTFAIASSASAAEQPRSLKLLFLGQANNAGHQPVVRFRIIQPVLAKQNIDVAYTDSVGALEAKNLATYDGLVIYSNLTRISPEQEKALLDFVEGGKAFIPLHCASYCFQNSQKYIDLVGAQFQRHGTGTFRVTNVAPDHPIMKGFPGFESWDETYVHTKHNEKDRTLLEVHEENGRKEPWTWVRTQGKGRVFYTAWGHDQRTWNNPAFQNLLVRGIRWAVGDDPLLVGLPQAPPKVVKSPQEETLESTPKMTAKRTDVKPFEFVEANVPFYPPRGSANRGRTLNQMQKPLDIPESMKHYVHPEGFELKLFVDESQLGGKPICMNWDERGRLWAAITVDYPNDRARVEGQGHDRIVVCEDTDGDGKADKITTFAENLSIPTSLIMANGGVVCFQYPHTLFLKDTDGDGKADVRQVLFSGWGFNDTHAGPSNLRYGLDNWLYGIVGYSGFNGRVGGEQHRFSQALYRFRPDGSKMEMLRNTSNNSWGVGFSEEGVLFASTANGNPSVYMPIPNRYFEKVRGWSSAVLPMIATSARFFPITEKIRQVDFHGSFTAGAGHAVYTARTYPPEYWNRTAFVSDPTGHLTATFFLERRGADFRSRNAWNLVASDDEWAAPIMAEVGPDGNVWVIDWYAFIVQHNPTPPGHRAGRGAAYETPLRDHQRGRIYRLVYTGKNADTSYKPMSLAGATPEMLVATLKNDNMFWRLQAQRLLVERGQTDVVPALLKLADDTSMDSIGLNPGATHALWTLHGLGVMDGKHAEATAAVVKALKHPSAGVRRNAAQVLPSTTEAAVQAILDAKLLTDPDAQVRLEALLALADMPPSTAAGNAIAAAIESDEYLQDPRLAEAATSAAAVHDLPFLKAIAGRRSTQSQPARLTELVSRVANHYARGGPADTVGSVLAALAGAPEPIAAAVLDGLSVGWQAGRVPTLSADAEKSLIDLLPKLAPAARGRLVSLTVRWGSKAMANHASAISATFLNQARDEKETIANRLAAARQLIEFHFADLEPAKQLLDMVTPSAPPELANGILEVLMRSEAYGIPNLVLDLLPTLTPAVRTNAVRVMIGRSDGTRVMIDALDNGMVPLADLTLDQRQVLTSLPNTILANRAKALLAKGGALPDADREKILTQMLPITQRTGDAAIGKQVFTAQCAKCHTHSGEGAKIGPDLTGMAVHPKAHLLGEIIDPNKSVEGNYRQYMVMTKAGKVISGLLSSESRTAIEVIDAEAQKHAVQREDIDQFQTTNRSLMPEGFEKQLSEADLTNLLEFLTVRGKYLPLPLEKVATVVTTRGMFNAPDNTTERLVFPDWGTKTFEGVPFVVVDPMGERVPNAILLNGPNGVTPPKMPKSVRLPVNAPLKTVHMLSGVSGWGFPYSQEKTVSVIVRLHYADGTTEDHELRNGVHFADYISRRDVPESKFAFNLRGRQMRYLAVTPKKAEAVKEIEFIKGPDETAPIVMAVTVEPADGAK